MTEFIQPADEKVVRAISTYLEAQLLKYGRKHPEVSNSNVLMAIHNFYKRVILDVERDLEEKDPQFKGRKIIRNMALKTLQSALLEDPNYVSENKKHLEKYK